VQELHTQMQKAHFSDFSHLHEAQTSSDKAKHIYLKTFDKKQRFFLKFCLQKTKSSVIIYIRIE